MRLKLRVFAGEVRSPFTLSDKVASENLLFVDNPMLRTLLWLRRKYCAFHKPN